MISYYIPALNSLGSGDDALAIMDEHKITHLPVVKNNNYVGLLSEDMVLDMEDSAMSIGDSNFALLKPFVNIYAHVFDIIRIIDEFKITAIPVLDDGEDYIGLITIQDMAFQFAKITNATEPGGVLVLSVNARDYSLSQAAQIVESDNAKILSSYISGGEDSMAIDLILKINKSDLSSIIKSFERFEYKIKASFHESSYDENLNDRYNQFMRYLNT